MPRSIKNLFLIVCSLAVLFVLAETALRIKAWISHVSLPISSAQIVQHAYYNPFLIFGPDINKQLKQNNGEYVVWNSQGFRMQGELPLKKEPNEYRIFALGGSTTEDIQNQQNLHYCGEANKIFAEKIKNRKVVCINAGKSAFTSAHSLVRLETDLLAFKPDMITVMHNVNDLSVNFYPFDGRYNYGNKYLSDSYAPRMTNWILFKRILEKSRAFSYLFNTLQKAKTKPNMRINPKPTDLVFKEAFRNNLTSIVGVAKAHGIEVVLLTEPGSLTEKNYYTSFSVTDGSIQYPPPEEFKKLYEEYNQVIKEVATQTHAGFIDMYGLVGHDEKYFTDIVHTNADGVLRVGDLYANNLIQFIR